MSSNPSITRRLLWLIVVPVILLIIVCAGLAARTASQSVNKLFDEQMQNNAGVLLSFVLYEAFEHESDRHEDEDDEDDESEELLEIAESINTERGLPVNFRLMVGNRTQFVSPAVREFPACVDGFSNIELAAEQQGSDDWRCYQQTQELFGGRESVIVETFESRTDRDEAIRSLVVATFSPLILLPILVVALAYWAVSRAMKSLRRVSHEVAERSVNNLTRLPLNEQPAELLPVADSVNRLLDGIESGLQREKQFTDDAAHELRTPLTSIKMLEQLLRRENTDQTLVQYLDNLRDSVDQSSAVIEQLLGFARLQSAKSLTFEPLDIRSLVHEELGLLAPHLTGKHLAVELADNSYHGMISGNAPALSLLIRNVLTNACKFSENTGTIYIVLDNDKFVVEDDGPGIEEINRLRVFDRFYRAPNAKSESGSGLGLALAKWVADTHGFALYARTPVKGRGACIVLRFGR